LLPKWLLRKRTVVPSLLPLSISASAFNHNPNMNLNLNPNPLNLDSKLIKIPMSEKKRVIPIDLNESMEMRSPVERARTILGIPRRSLMNLAADSLSPVRAQFPSELPAKFRNRMLEASNWVGQNPRWCSKRNCMQLMRM